MRVCFIITSVINFTNRFVADHGVVKYNNGTNVSVFDSETRLNQTLETIESIKEKMPNARIFLHEKSDLENNYISILKSKVDRLYCHHSSIDKNLFKSIPEAMLLHKIFSNKKLKEYDFIFKISGRYKLNDNFHPYYLLKSNRDKIIAKRRMWPHLAPHKNYNTVLYCVGRDMIDYAAKSYEDAYKNMFVDIEHSIFRDINENNFVNINIVGVEGHISPTGEFFKE